MAFAPMTDAVVARIHDYAETSAVVVLLTADRGAVHAVAKGAKRVANGFRGPVDRGVLYRVRLAGRRGGGLAQLNSGTVLEAFPALRRDPRRFVPAALVLEVASDLMRQDEPHPELFRLAVFTLKVLDRAPPERLALAMTMFLVRAVALSGHAPSLDRCVACDGTLDGEERPLLSAARGGFLHADCGQGEEGARPVAPRVHALYGDLFRRRASLLLEQQSPPPAHLRELRRALVDWLQHVLERRFRAAWPMEREFVRSGP